MDMRTGRIYESKEAALADGVPEGDAMEITRDLEYWLKRTNTKIATPHQGKREMQRRLKKAQKV